MNQFDHEKLDVYRLAVSFLNVANRVISRLPRGYAYFKDQLGRASLSIVANIGEGANEFMPAEKARFYRMASRSATECAALLDACNGLRLADPEVTADGRELLLRIVSMLIALAKRNQQRATETPVPVPVPIPDASATTGEGTRDERG